jgi:hypothetical protein
MGKKTNEMNHRKRCWDIFEQKYGTNWHENKEALQVLISGLQTSATNLHSNGKLRVLLKQQQIQQDRKKKASNSFIF